MKRMFGIFEAVFDLFYLGAALIIAMVLLRRAPDSEVYGLCANMALILVLGDAFHLVPRIRVIFTGEEERFRPALGRGKQITSITMTVFYLLLWQIGLYFFHPEGAPGLTALVYLLAAVRVLLCLLPQNQWAQRYPPVRWGIWRNIPFFLQGMLVAGLFFVHANAVPQLRWMWLAIVLSFLFYLPVVLFANKNPKVGMLMLPKTCAYLWMLWLCLAL